MRPLSHRKILSLAVGFGAALATAGCLASAGSSERGFVSGGLVSRFVDGAGAVYMQEGGPFRADMLNLSMLTQASGPMMTRTDNRRVVADETFTIEGVARDEWIVGRVVGNDAGSEPPFCRSDRWVQFFMPVGLVPYPPPGHLTSASSRNGGPTPTPTPVPQTEASGPVELAAQGLIAAGWPHIDSHAGVLYKGRHYHPAGSHYTGGGPIDAAFPWIPQGEVDLIAVEFLPRIEAHPEVEHVISTETVTDYVRVYRPARDPDLDGILVDFCPSDFRQDGYVFYRNVAHVEPEESPSVMD